MCAKRYTGLVDDSLGFDPFVEQHVRWLALDVSVSVNWTSSSTGEGTHHHILGVSLRYAAVVAI